MDYMIEFGIDILIPLKKFESHMCSLLCQVVPDWLTFVLPNKL